MELSDIQRPIGKELALVEEEIKRSLHSHIGLIRQTGSYITKNKGKLIRPTLLLLTSRLLGYAGEKTVLYAAIVECIHTATLLHDDIVDEASIRRGQESLNSRFGNEITVLLGDYFYIRSMANAIFDGVPEIPHFLSRTTFQMVEGELFQLDRKWDIDILEQDQLAIVERKTASLFAACCRIPAILADLPEAQKDLLTRVGLAFGMAFQLTDDLLDFIGERALLGKPVLNDLREGKITLPVVYLLEASDGKAHDMLQTVVEEQGFRSVQEQKVLGMVNSCGALERTRAKAKGYVEAAKRELEQLGNVGKAKTLESLLQFVVERRH